MRRNTILPTRVSRSERILQRNANRILPAPSPPQTSDQEDLRNLIETFLDPTNSAAASNGKSNEESLQDGAASGSQNSMSNGDSLQVGASASQDGTSNEEPPQGDAFASQNGDKNDQYGKPMEDSPQVDVATSPSGDKQNGKPKEDAPRDDTSANSSGGTSSTTMAQVQQPEATNAVPTPALTPKASTPALASTPITKRKAATKEEASAAMKSADEILSQLGGLDEASKLLENTPLKALFQSLIACKDSSQQAIMELDKKPRNKKRSLFDASERLSQVKDDQVRKKCKAVLESFQTLQNAANYQDKDQRDVLPTCDFMMVCRDAMLPNISSCKDGLWKRKSPLWAFLIPQGVDVKQLGADLEAVGKALSKRGKRAQDCIVTESSDAFQKALYGKTYGKKKDKEEVKQAAV